MSHGRPKLIDHILLSAALVRTVESAEAVIDEPLPSVTNDPTPGTASRAPTTRPS